MPIEPDLDGFYEEFGENVLLLDGSGGEFSSYNLYDITNDGIPELILFFYEYYGSSSVVVVSYDGNMAQYMGTCELGKYNSRYFSEAENALLIAEEWESDLYLVKVQGKDNQRTEEVIYEIHGDSGILAFEEVPKAVPDALHLPNSNMQDNLLISVYEKWLSDHKTEFVAKDCKNPQLRQSYLDVIEQNTAVSLTDSDDKESVTSMGIYDYLMQTSGNVVPESTQTEFIDLNNDGIEECVLRIFNTDHELCAYVLLSRQEDDFYGFVLRHADYQLDETGTFTYYGENHVQSIRYYFDENQWLVYDVRTS